MASNWKTYAGLAAPMCVVCCAPVEECQLVMPHDSAGVPTTPYADATEAAAQLTDRVVDCLVEFESSISDETAAIVGGDLVVTAATPAFSFFSIPFGFWAPLLLRAGTVTVSYDVVFNREDDFVDDPCNSRPFFGQVEVSIYNAAGDLIDSDSIGPTADSATGSFSLTVPSDGCYFVHFKGVNIGAWNSCEEAYTLHPGQYIDGSATIANAGLAAGTIAAAWDDGVDTGTVICS